MLHIKNADLGMKVENFQGQGQTQHAKWSHTYFYSFLNKFIIMDKIIKCLLFIVTSLPIIQIETPDLVHDGQGQGHFKVKLSKNAETLPFYLKSFL